MQKNNKKLLPDTSSLVNKLPCSSQKVKLPYTLTFDRSVAGTLSDRNGRGTGFTTVSTYTDKINSGNRRAKNNIPNYQPSMITLSGGHLQLLAGKEIDYRSESNQANMLGIRMAAVKKLQLEVKLINPNKGTQPHQGGLWYGLNDRTYVKLGIIGNHIELRKERNDISDTSAGTGNSDQRITSDIKGLNSKSVILRMVIDSAANTVEGFYSTDGIVYKNTGLLYPSSGLNISGMGVTDSVAYAGLFASNGDGSKPVVYDFDDFSVKDLLQSINTDFVPEGVTAPTGYVADVGLPFNEERKSGWINPATREPVSLKANMRLRKGNGSVKQRALVQMQATTDDQVPGSWEYAVKNGRYTVTVSAGDNDFYDSDHQINVEGLPAISDFKPTPSEKFRTGTVTVQVRDGRLTIDAAGGVNTKMNYVNISRSETVEDTVAPIASARLAGAVKSPDVYKNQAKVYISATDKGGSGLTSLKYSINDGTYINYNAPFTIKKPGNYKLKIKAVDANDNETIGDEYKFRIIGAHTDKRLAFSAKKVSFTVIKGEEIVPQSVSINGASSISVFNLSNSKAEWLTLPKKSSGVLKFDPQNISSDVEPGNYQALITCNAAGYSPATLLVDLHVIEGTISQAINVDFQDPQSEPPLGYVADYGQAYGKRTGMHQGAGLEYGWKKRSDGSLLDLTANGRNRNTPEDVLLATLVHMQANHIHSIWNNGMKTEGYWEINVPNGIYDVTVSVGDGTLNMAPEYHTINVEGVNAINKFVPNGKKGTISRFKSATVRINVADEHLTLDADGGTSTKINFVSIVPVSQAPHLYWASNSSNIIIKKGDLGQNRFSVVLGSSNNVASSYFILAGYGSGAAKWLKLKTVPAGIQPNIVFDYSAARDLPVGIYKATIKAVSSQFTSASFQIQLNVVDGDKPYVVSSSPANGATKVSLSTVNIAANNLHIPVAAGFKGGVDNSTITNSSVQLLKLVDKGSVQVKGVVQGTGGGDAISFTPFGSLEANTVYKFVVTSGVKSYTGAEFAPYEATFVTDAAKVDSSNILDAQFTKIAMPGTQNKKYCSLTIGPDGRFYALRLDGTIERYNINHADGMLSGQKIISTLVRKYGMRSAIGLTFDPQSTPSNLIAWVSHSSAGLSAAPAFDGNISRLQGENLQYEQLAVTKLPRSKRDHLVNSLAFGPDGAMYICQGSMSSAGSYDDDWQRDETLLAGTILRLDMKKLSSFAWPLNVKTTSNQNVINRAPAKSASMRDGSYNPYGSSAPLTIFASGVRNAFDLVWHSNGQLYLPTNGSGGGGNSPESEKGTRRPDGTFYSGPHIPATTKIQAQHDWLFRINPAKPVGYYGHPNPLRGEYVLNRGFEDNPLYLPTVKPDSRYRGAYDFGLNKSPNGVIEYKSNTFNGILKGKLLVCRFSGGGDIVVMEPGSLVRTNAPDYDDSVYDIVKITTGSGNSGLVGMSGFGNPLDIVEDVVNGNLYVIQYNWNDSPNLTSQITLLRANSESATVVLAASGGKLGDKNIKKVTR